MQATYELQPLSLLSERSLKSLTALFDSPDVEVFVLAGTSHSRVESDGVTCLIGSCGGRSIAVTQFDFRISGGSFSKLNSRRLVAFIEMARHQKMPLAMQINSLGVRIMEGRTVFSDAFNLIPALLRFRESAPLLTCASGRCLGLAAILFGMGQHRSAIQEDTTLNLTGPEVLKLFFGESFDFDSMFSAHRQFDRTSLIQELLPSRESWAARVRQVVGMPRGFQARPLPAPGEETRLQAFLKRIGDGYEEIFPGSSPVIRTFILGRGSDRVGVLMNPPGRPNNLITVDALTRYCAALDLFRAMALPVISILDTPGMDPRVGEAERDLIGWITQTAGRAVAYPHPKMGVLWGRAFGGATSLGFPKIFGGTKVLAVRGCTLGIMHESIIEKLLSGSPRLLEQWKGSVQAEDPELRDLIDSGTIDFLIEPDQLAEHIDDFLAIRRRRQQVSATDWGTGLPIRKRLRRQAIPAEVSASLAHSVP